VLLDRFARIWRIAGTGFAFACLFGGGAVLALTAFPFVHLVTPRGPLRRQRNQYLIHLAFRVYVGMLQTLRLLDLQVVGREQLDEGMPRLIVANHPSLLDVVFLMSLVPQAQCVVKKELWSSPYLGGLVRHAGYIRNDLDAEALIAECELAMAQGNSLIIFPEGTRTTPGQPRQFLRGFANIATLLEAQIQLVTITCDPSTLTKGEKWWMIPPRRPVFRVHVGERIDAKGWLGCAYRSLAARKLVRQLEAYYEGQLGHG
jgi:1-acyl-sn-glycerol-3-phosphate acyltransferase